MFPSETERVQQSAHGAHVWLDRTDEGHGALVCIAVERWGGVWVGEIRVERAESGKRYLDAQSFDTREQAAQWVAREWAYKDGQ